MSFGAGGLAQMTYNPGGGIGLPGSGFASRGKAGHIKRLSVAPASAVDDGSQGQPRTSRSHLLAGLRTAPRDPTAPITAPPTQLQFPGGLGDGAGAQYAQYAQAPMPRTATAAGFGSVFRSDAGNPRPSRHNYTPSQVLAPPAIRLGDENGDDRMDPGLYEELVRTNEYLAQQQMRLRQQLINVTAAAQRFDGMGMGMGMGQGQQQYAGQVPAGPAMGFYGQQLQSGLQPVVEPVAGQPGLYTVYSPMTGQSSFFYDRNAQQQTTLYDAGLGARDLSHSPPPPTPTFLVSPTPEAPAVPKGQSAGNWRSASPSKAAAPSPPRDEALPLPPPSAGAFRPGSRKELSLGGAAFGRSAPSGDAPRTAGLRNPGGVPQTPLTGSFGPGQHREGEHPVRQPRGPPSLEELVARPTTRFEGSKNFAARQRRQAVHSLVRAGLERRVASTRSGSRGGGGATDGSSPSPRSEAEFVFSVSSSSSERGEEEREDTDGIHSGSESLSGRPSLGNIRAASRAIGSERKEMQRRRNSGDDGDEIAAGSPQDEGEREEGEEEDGGRRRSALLPANVGKRRSMVY